jgi:tetratricopeptide (TPR) repeat protein
MGHRRELSTVYLNKGIIYDIQWDLFNAEKYYKKSLSLCYEIEYQEGLINTLNCLGIVYRNQNRLGDALVNFNKVLEMNTEKSNNLGISQVLQELIVTYLKAENYDIVETYLDQLFQISKGEDNLKIQGIYLLTKALVLKSNERIADQAEAQKILNTIIKNEHGSYDYHEIMESFKQLCEILIKEVEWSKSKVVEREIYGLFDRMQSIGEGKPSIRLKIEILILKSKTSFILRDWSSAINTLQEAEKIALDNNLNYLIEKVNDEQRILDENIRTMERLIDDVKTTHDLPQQFAEDYLEYLKRAGISDKIH